MIAMLLSDIAQVIRSKNAGPRRLTLDIMFASDTDYQRVAQSPEVSREAIGRLYRIAPEDAAVIPYRLGARSRSRYPVRPLAIRAIATSTAHSSTHRCCGSRYERLAPHSG